MNDSSALQHLSTALSTPQTVKRSDLTSSDGPGIEPFDKVMAREKQPVQQRQTDRVPNRQQEDSKSHQQAAPVERSERAEQSTETKHSTANGEREDNSHFESTESPTNEDAIPTEFAQYQDTVSSEEETASNYRQLALNLGQSLPFNSTPELIGPPVPVEEIEEIGFTNEIGLNRLSANQVLATTDVNQQQSLDFLAKAQGPINSETLQALPTEQQQTIKLTESLAGLNSESNQNQTPANPINQPQPIQELNGNVKLTDSISIEPSALEQVEAGLKAIAVNVVSSEDAPLLRRNLGAQSEQNNLRAVSQAASLVEQNPIGGDGINKRSLSDKLASAIAVDTVTDKVSTHASSSEASPLIKLANGSSDSAWSQQFQQLSQIADSGKTGPTQLQLPLNLHNPKWFAAVADRVSWLASQSVQAAEIHLDPPELGPLHVRIAVNHDQASVNFVSHQAAVREVLDAHLMRLKELFSNEGMQLIDVNVSDRQQQEQQSSAQGGPHKAVNADQDSEPQLTVPINHINSWVDYYV